MDDEYLITLKCCDCENYNCSICPLGTVIDEDNLRGCTRRVSEEDYAKYEHYIDEVSPFLYITDNKEASSRAYREIIDFLFYIYNKPLGTKIGKNGRALSVS